MKKRIHLTLFFISFIFSVPVSYSQATQPYCGSARYDTEVFTTVSITQNVTFGSNIDLNGNTVTLTMDIYEPDGDTASIRPLIIWAHGGSFMGGSKNDPDVTAFSNHFAKRGYVCVSINYRLGIPFPPNQTTATRAVYRAVQDMKAAIRYFRQDAATTNDYHIDPNVIFCGGSSAGAFTALHLAYLNQPSELPSQIDTLLLGGMEGESGNPGYPSNVSAIVNLCGALGDTAWMVPGDIPVCSVHGTNDDVVPYATDMLSLLNIFPIMIVHGSYSVNEHATYTGIENTMYTFYGAVHVPYAGNAAILDTSVRFVSNFLYRMMGCQPADPFPLANTWNTVSVAESGIADNGILLFPNPASEKATLEISSFMNQESVVSITDLSGRSVLKMAVQLHEGVNRVELNVSELAAGLYLVVVGTGKESMPVLLDVSQN